MSEEENIEKNLKNQKSESPQEEVNENILPTGQAGSQEQTETTNQKSEIQKSEIENMEVHHHPNLHHRKKHWKEYFLEFLMIFLAVTLGFFAENIRETISDNHRGSQYVASELADVKIDSVNISNAIKEYQKQQKCLDSLLDNFDEINKPGLSELWIRNERYYQGFADFVYTDRTIQQLKNAGGLRMIADIPTEDSIADYDQLVRLVQLQLDPVIKMYYECGQKDISIFNLQKIREARKENGGEYPYNTTEDFLFTHDKRELGVFYGDILHFNGSCSVYLLGLTILQKKADGLITFLQKKYKLQ